MSTFLDLSVKNFTGNYTHKAKAFSVKTQILMKIPKWDLTTIRLIGTNFNITEFLRSVNSGSNPQLTEAAIRDLVHAIKPLIEDAPHWKNRTLMENQNAS